MEITPAKLITIVANANALLMLNDLTLTASIESSVKLKENGQIDVDLIFGIFKSTPKNEIAYKYKGEYNSTVTNDGNSIDNDKLDIYEHIKIGLIFALNKTNWNDTEVLKLALENTHIPPACEKIIDALTEIGFYK